MKKMKLEKGITIISLIITIIVLLLLAVVAIGAMQESKIIVHAQNARERYQIEKIEEKIKLEKSEMKLAEYGKEITVIDILKKYEGEEAKIEPVSIASNAKSIPENMPAGNYYILEPDKYADTTNQNIRKYAKITSRGDIREENILKDVYVINDQLDIYYIIEGSLSKITGDDDIEIADEKDLTAAIYYYASMYNPEQPEIVDPTGYYDDENNDKMSDINSYLGAYIGSGYFNIEKSFFGQEILEPGDIIGNITAKITHFNGTEEEITLLTTDNEKWTYESEGSDLMTVDKMYIGFRPFSKYNNVYEPEQIDRYQSSSDYHYMYIDTSNAVPFHKLTMFGKTIEFPYNCQSMIGVLDLETGEVAETMYNNIADVSKVIVNFSDNTSKAFTKTDIFDANLYYGEDFEFFYSSPEVPILYAGGMFYINMPEAGLKTQIASIIVEENGVATKYKVSDSTMVGHLTSSN